MSGSRKNSKKPRRKRKSFGDGGCVVSADEIEAAISPLELPAEEKSQFAEAIGRRHANVMRMRRDRTKDPAASGDVPWYSLARVIRDGYQASRSIDYAAGDFYLQDAGSLLALAAAEADGDRLRDQLVCDLCAAPGGKASGLLEAISGRGFLLANEPIRSRIAPLAYNLARTGSNRYAISGEDPDSLANQLPGTFDVVVVDAPCSGQALLSRGRQTKGAINESMIVTNAARQRRILAAAHTLLCPGGTLVYSTCTFAPAENESQVTWLIESLGMSPAPLDSLRAYQSPLIQCGYRVWPHRDACAGAFASRLIKRVDEQAPLSDDASFAESAWDKRRGVLQSEQPLDSSCQELIDQVYGDRHQGRPVGLVRQRDWIAEAFCDDAPDWVKQDWTIGPEIAHRTGQTWKPSHASALRSGATLNADSVTRIDVDDAGAMAYLAGGTVPTTHRGWAIVEHSGRPLGWVKADGRIGKNHLPTHARLNVARHPES